MAQTAGAESSLTDGKTISGGSDSDIVSADSSYIETKGAVGERTDGTDTPKEENAESGGEEAK